MYKNYRIAVIVPCYNEETLIERVLSTMPDYVDSMIVIDDASRDNTGKIIEQYQGINKDKLVYLRHAKNQGVGASIATGYVYARDNKFDVAVVMAGDAQMDPDDLPSILDPVVSGEVDYSKGNRLFTGQAWKMIPKVRYLGNSMLSLLTKIASGYWHIADSQSGYTAISLRALQTIDWSRMYKRYGQPNDLLVRLNIENFSVRDVPVKPVYGIGEKSGIKPIRMIPKLFWLLLRLHLFRLVHKYIIRDFHPLVFFYMAAATILPPGILFGIYLLIYRIMIGPVAETSALFAAFLTLSGFQFLFFAMYFDMEKNKELR
jgi:glycosyltransferase involved in cell wall biosynthesis